MAREQIQEGALVRLKSGTEGWIKGQVVEYFDVIPTAGPGGKGYMYGGGMTPGYKVHILEGKHKGETIRVPENYVEPIGHAKPGGEPLYPHVPKSRQPLFPHVPGGRQPGAKLPATEKPYQRGADGEPKVLKHFWVEENKPYGAWAIVEAFPGGTIRSPFDTKEGAIKREEEIGQYYEWKLKLVPSPQEKFPKQHEVLKGFYRYEIIEYHDDGDLTIQSFDPLPRPKVGFKKGYIFVVTTDGTIFKQERPPATTEKLPQTLPRTGTCYADAWRFLIKEEEGKLIHGTLFSGGRRTGHAWVETPTGWVWEPETGKFFTVLQFKDAFAPVIESRYTAEEAAIMAARTKNLGPWSEQERVQYLGVRQPQTKEKLYQKGPDGYPIGADKIMRDAWGPMPDPDQPFWSGKGFIKPVKIYGWQWSPDYHSWRAYVRFPDGTETWTSPREQTGSSLELLASTEGDPIRKFCCRKCGECAPKELLEEGKFLDRISWLRSHYKEKHPGTWGKRLPLTVIEGFEPVSPQYRHLVGLVSEPLPKEAD